MHRVLIIFAFVLIAKIGTAQVYFEEPVDSTTSINDRMYFGGNFSLNFGSFTFIDVSPLAGYMLTENFSVGLGASYSYVSRELIFLPGPRRVRISNSAYGGRIFARQNVLEDYFAHFEFESINTEFLSRAADDTIRDWVPGLFVGGGITQGIFTRGGANLTILYNLLHDEVRSPYASAFVIRGGLTF